MVIPGAGHMAIMEAAAEVNDALRQMLIAASHRAATMTRGPAGGGPGRSGRGAGHGSVRR